MKTSVFQSHYRDKSRRKNVEAGLCRDCGGERERKDQVYCTKCLSAQKYRRDYWKRRWPDNCQGCGAGDCPDQYCPECKEKRRKYQAEYRKTHPRPRKIKDQYVRCPQCLKQRAIWVGRRRAGEEQLMVDRSNSIKCRFCGQSWRRADHPVVQAGVGVMRDE
jgi:hypothetical protein